MDSTSNDSRTTSCPDPVAAAGGADGAPVDEVVGRFQRLHHDYEDDVFALMLSRVKNRETALELTQDVFLKAWKGRKTLDPTRDGRPWLMTIANNRLTDYFRSTATKKRGKPMSLTELLQRPGDGSYVTIEPPDVKQINPVDAVLTAEAINQMDLAAQQLSASDQQLYRLRRSGMSTAEIAEETGRKKSAVDPATSRMLDKLSDKLTPNDP